MKPRDAFLHLAVAALGLLAGLFAPSAWQLPIFFVALALTVASAIAAHAYPDSKARSRAGTAAVFLLNFVIGGPGGQIKRGQGPLYFTLALLFTISLVGGLTLAHNAA